jgi:hypothetical protein
MTNYDASSLITTTISSYIASAASVHEQIAKIDFVTRLTLALSAPGALSRTNLQIPPIPGLGALQEMLEQVKEHAQVAPFLTIAEAGLRLLATPLPLNDQDLRSVYRLRNYLFHGGALPESSVSASIASSLTSAISECSANIALALSGARINSTPITDNLSSATLDTGGLEYDLFPLLAVSPASNSALVFSRVTSGLISFSAPKYESRNTVPRSCCEDKLRRLFKPQRSTDTLIADFTQAALDDLEGFRERGTSITYVVEADGVYIRWEHASGRDTVVRQDQLRIGPDNAWQWHDGSSWKGYSEFLRYLANWPILTRRFANLLHERTSDARESENVLLPLPEGIQPPFVPPSVTVAQIGLEKKEYTLDKFTERLDDDVLANRGTTYLYFVHAEAGAGKTTALLKTAQTRADNCAAGEKTLPIFLYVSARGNVLENLDQAVDAAVAETHLLTSTSVRALCRNGLIIPIIDGFDELVGSPTYADALAALRPWLQSLGGRGVLVVSARSNYFMSLYQESIRKETNSDISVTHLIAELDRWRPEQRDNYLKSCGVEEAQLRRLPPSELEMLRLPFFARASVSHLLSAALNPAEGLVRNLMRGYVEREQGKLQGPAGETIVTAVDLENFFEELAANMMEENIREVPFDDLIFYAQISMGEMSADVKNRLVALCGLDVREGRRFRFMHEIIMDFFFGRRVGHKLNAEDTADLQRILNRSHLTAGAARVAVDMWKPKPSLLLALMKPKAGPVGVAPLKANLGTLWREVFSLGQPLRMINIEEVQFSRLEISNRGLNSLTFTKCDFSSVTILNLEMPKLRFVDCNFQELQLVGSGKDLSFEKCLVDLVLTTIPRTYAEDPDEVIEALRKTGAQVIARSYSAVGSASETVRRAEFFLEKINRRADLSIVINEWRLPEDASRFGWIIRNQEDWLKFLEALEANKLVSLEHFNAGGPPKRRFRWAVQPMDILNRNSTEPRIRGFWEALASK